MSQSEGVKTTHLMHEIILSLTGVDTMFTSEDPAVQNYNKSLIEPTEAELIDRILAMGKHYRVIQDYITKTNQEKLKNEKIGLYTTTFVEALSAETQPYWNTLVSLEQDSVKDDVSLQFIWCKIYEFYSLLTEFKKIVNHITEQKLRGCMLLDYMQNQMQQCSGLTETFQRIIMKLNKVFYHQIFCWMVYGQLVDPYREFFVKERSASTSSDTPFERFTLNSRMLPEFVTKRFATKILQIGQTVLFLRSNPRMPYHEENVDPRTEICVMDDELMRKKGKRIQKKIQEMEMVACWNERNVMVNFTAQIFACVNKELWNLAHNDANIIEQMRLVKEFFLLGRGELFQEFVVQVDHTFARGLAGSNESTIDSDLNSILQEAGQKIHVKEDFLQRFKLEYKRSDNDEKPMSLGGEWSNVTVKYDIPWPLELLFTPPVLHSYNRIFQFLLRLKKIQIQFVNCWMSEKNRTTEDCNRRRVLLRNLWFLINNLQSYLHADVLESQFDIFESAVNNSKNFDEIDKAHRTFIENLVCQLFLFKEVGSSSAKTAINIHLNKIMKICEDFIYEVEVQGDRKIDDAKLKSMRFRFESYVEYLLKLLAKFSNEDSYPGNQYLSQFLLRLDYNSFFIKQMKTDTRMLYI